MVHMVILGASGVHPGLKARACAHIHTYTYAEGGGGREEREGRRKGRTERGRKKGEKLII